MGEPAPRNFFLQANWKLEIDGIERARFGKVTGLGETVTDVVIRQSAQTWPDRAPGLYQPVEITVEAPAYLDPSIRDLWTKTIDIINGGGNIGEELYFSADLVQLDRDKSTELERYRLHRCYCGGRTYGDRDAEADDFVRDGFMLRPKRIEQIAVQ